MSIISEWHVIFDIPVIQYLYFIGLDSSVLLVIGLLLVDQIVLILFLSFNLVPEHNVLLECVLIYVLVF